MRLKGLILILWEGRCLVVLGPACLSSPSWRCGHVLLLPSLAPIAGALRGDTESLWGTHTLVSPTDLSGELCNSPSL